MKQELIGGLVMCLIGLGLFFVSPVTLWTLTEKWKTQGGERPTKEYTILIRVLGAVSQIANDHFISGIICFGAAATFTSSANVYREREKKEKQEGAV